MTKKFADMNLTEQCLAYARMLENFPGGRGYSQNEVLAMELCEKDIPPDHECIPVVVRREISIDGIKLATPVRPSTETPIKSTFGERSTQEAMRLAKEYNESVTEGEQRSWTHFVYC